jgi:tetratricopeptide (TPR) repeat protein
MAHDVFISYSHHDATVAHAVCGALEADGVQCWMAPRDVVAGRSYPAEIVRAIAASRVMVLVLSANASASEHVLRELERAVNKHLVIVPFRIENVELSPEMEYYLSVPHWLDASTGALEPHLQELVHVARVLLAPKSDPVVPPAELTPADVRVRTPDASRAQTPAPVRVLAPASKWRSAFQRRRALPYLLGALAVVLAFGARPLWELLGSFREPKQNLVAFVPFRLTASDTAIHFLSLGMAELLAEKLKTEGGPQPADAGAVFAAWQREGGTERTELPQEKTMSVAQRVGANQVVVGSIIGDSRRVTVKARLLAVPGGSERATATASGALDNVSLLVDSVAAELLSRQAGEAERLYMLKAVPLQALRAYIEGKQAYRRGQYLEALKRYEEALDIDSTMAFAAFGVVVVSNNARVANESAERALRLAWRVRENLNPRDRTYLYAHAGHHYPAISTSAEQVHDWEIAAEKVARGDAYLELGERLFQYGHYVGRQDAHVSATRAFERALALDSALVPAMWRLAELAALSGDSARFRHFADRLHKTDSTADISGFIRWRATRTLAGDGRTTLDWSRMSNASLRQIYLIGQLDGDGSGMRDAARAAEELSRNVSRTDQQQEDIAAGNYLLAMNQGRVREARFLLDSIALNREYLVPLLQGQQIRDALVAGGDSVAAVAAVEALTRAIDDAPSAPTAADAAILYIATCAVEQWRIFHGNTSTAAASLARIRAIVPLIQQDTQRVGGSTTPVLGSEPPCPAVIDAMLAVAERRPDAGAAIDRLDVLMSHGPMDGDASIGNLVVARLREGQGDRARALIALRRRPYAILGLFFLAPSLLEEGRLAALTGDREGAIKAYRHYLALRSKPDARLNAEVQQARDALARLQLVADARTRSRAR